MKPTGRSPPPSTSGCRDGPFNTADCTIAGMATSPAPAWQTKAQRVSPGFHEAYTTLPPPSHRPATKVVRMAAMNRLPLAVRPW
ncbi:MAG: hypothetical protein EBX36_10730 [Planctomycetia bacterium]|nr:hypothetical protein [Planctomycetia bacterium]